MKSGDIRDLAGTVQRENAAIGVFITLEPNLVREHDVARRSAPGSTTRTTGTVTTRACKSSPSPTCSPGRTVQMPPQSGTFSEAEAQRATARQTAIPL